MRSARARSQHGQSVVVEEPVAASTEAVAAVLPRANSASTTAHVVFMLDKLRVPPKKAAFDINLLKLR